MDLRLIDSQPYTFFQAMPEKKCTAVKFWTSNISPYYYNFSCTKPPDARYKTLQPLLQKAEAGQCQVLFMDSAHFVLAAFVAVVWYFERVFVKTAPGRFRLNVIGAINATTQQ
jgi:hypothetical protein